LLLIPTTGILGARHYSPMTEPSPERDLPSKPLFLRNLGGLSLESRGRPIGPAGSQPARLALLSVIARSGSKGVTRDRLHAWFWPESDLDRARNALNQALYALRRDVAEQELILGTNTLRVNPEVVDSDVDRFEQALDSGQLESAIRIYLGPFLDGVHCDASAELEQWIDEQRNELAVRYAGALEQLAQGAMARGDRVASIAWWRRLALADPVNSKVALRLLEAHAAHGDRSGALLHAARYEERLRRELGIAPDADFLARVAAIKARGDPPRVGGLGDLSPAPTPASPEPAGAQPIPVPRRRSGTLVAAIALVGAGAGFVLLRENLGAGAVPDRYIVGRVSPVTTEPGLEIEPSLSPDGRFIAYAAGPLPRTRIYVRQPGGRAILATPDSGQAHRRPLWSPDGAQLLIGLGDSVENGLNYGIGVVPALGGNLRVLVANGVESVAWGPDSRRIAYVRGDTLYVGSTLSGPPRPIAAYQDMHALAWSPDGKWIAMAAGNSLYDTWGQGNFGDTAPSEILVVSASGGTPLQVAAPTSLNASPVWMPDSRRLLFVSNRDGPRDVYVAVLAESGRPRGNPVRLTTGLSAHSIALSADGRRLAYSAYYEQANIWALPIQPGKVATLNAAVPVTTGSQVVEAISISSDGKRLYFDSHHEGTSDIYRLALPDGQPVQLTHDPTDEFGPAESPDGRWVAFHSRHYGTRDIVVMPSEGGDPIRVTADPGEERFPWWSPDGRLLTYVLLNASDRNGRYVVSRNAAGEWSAPRKVGPGCWVQDWNPDNNAFLCTNEFTGVIWEVAIGEGNDRAIYTPRSPEAPRAGQAHSLRDGLTIVFRSQDTDGRSFFWEVPAMGGRPRLLARLDDLSRPSPRAWFATDGRQLYFTIHDRQSDIYVAELSTVR
jgi:Tol biopolymer transport system component/DNA-binding SARP family transcriptional activator